MLHRKLVLAPCFPVFLLLRAFYSSSFLFPAVKRLPEHIQVDDPAAQKKLAKKLERQQVGVRILDG